MEGYKAIPVLCHTQVTVTFIYIKALKPGIASTQFAALLESQCTGRWSTESKRHASFTVCDEISSSAYHQSLHPLDQPNMAARKSVLQILKVVHNWNPIRDRACLKRTIELHNYGIVRAISRRVHRVAYLAHLLNHIDDELLGTERRISELEIHLQISGFSLGSIASIINPPSGTANSLGMLSAVRPSGTTLMLSGTTTVYSRVLIR